MTNVFLDFCIRLKNSELSNFVSAWSAHETAGIVCQCNEKFVLRHRQLKKIFALKNKQTNKNKWNKQKKEQKQSNVFLIFKDRVIVSLFLIISINVLKILHLNCRRFFITTVCRVLIYPRIWTFRRDTKEFRP